MRCFDAFRIVISLKKHFNKHMSCQSLETPRRSCDVIAMRCLFQQYLISRKWVWHKRYGHLLMTNKLSGILHVGYKLSMMTSSNGNILRVTGHLCGEFTGPRWIPAQRPVTRRFDIFFDLRLNKRLSKQSRGWWFETLPSPLWLHSNAFIMHHSSSPYLPNHNPIPLINVKLMFCGKNVNQECGKRFHATTFSTCQGNHNDAIKLNHFPRYWLFVRGIHRWPVDSPHEGKWRGALMFSFMCAWTKGWTNNRDARDLRRHGAHCNATVL